MKLEGCRPNLITFNAAIDACTKGGVPLDRAWSLFQQMQDAGIQPDRVGSLHPAKPPLAVKVWYSAGESACFPFVW